MFHSMNLSEACSDMFDLGLRNNKLQVLYQANKNIKVRIKTTSGLTREETMDKLVMQCDTWSSNMASVQCDTFGKELLEEEASYIFRYKGHVPVGILGQIDDSLASQRQDLKHNN